MEILSETTCQGWLEGYLLTGRHGLFTTYEAFVHIVDSMFNQHAKWLESSQQHPLARAGRLAQLPAVVARLAAGPQRLFAPGPGLHRPGDEQEGRGHPRVPAAGRQHAAVGRWTTACAAATTSTSSSPASSRPCSTWTWTPRSRHCTAGHRHLGVGVSTDRGAEPDVVMACAGDIPDPRDAGRRRPAARAVPGSEDPRGQRRRPDAAAAAEEHPHGLSDRDFDSLFTTDRPVIFAYHGYPWLIHRLTYRRTNHANLHVRGYKEEGTTTTPFDMVALQRPGSLPPGDRRHRPGAAAGQRSARTRSRRSAID